MASAGTGLAASRYVISSSRQVKPGALSAANLSRAARRALRGRRGPAGPRGVTGQTGSPGQAGAPGDTGPRGPSDAWSVTQTGQANGANVPAGSYVVTGNVYFSTSSSPQCTVWHTTGGGGASGRISFAPGSASAYTMPVDDTFTVRLDSTVYVDCGGSSGTIIPQVAVLQVATLH